ncbi:MAG: L,D-transpeptidase family protein [Methylacidiphilales bacterium]|nr:L,D-transpeptidase family protein [Candidatus Methylacidiphilales bacterium]
MKAYILLFNLLFVTAVPANADSYNSKHPAPAIPSGYTTSACVQDPALARFAWLVPDTAPPVSVDSIVISIADQRLYVYHGQQLLAWSSISSGKPGHDTPTGDFTVSEKDINHHSNLYEDAPMPYYMRLTDGGVGMHAGLLPGYPASHGCIRLPAGMARELFQRVESGTSVQITDDPVSASVVEDPASASPGPIVQD